MNGIFLQNLFNSGFLTEHLWKIHSYAYLFTKIYNSPTYHVLDLYILQT